MGEWYFVWCLVSVQDWPSFDMWPWPLTLTPICQGQQPVTTGGKSANVTLSSLPMSVPFTLWIESLTFDLDPFLGHSSSTLLLQKFVSNFNVILFTLWKKVWPLTLTHFWVIQGQHFCYSTSQVFTDVIFKWRALGRKASILDPPLPLSQDPNLKFWNLPTYVQDITLQVLAYRLTTPKILRRVAVMRFRTEHIIFCPLGPISKFRNLIAYLQHVSYYISKEWFIPSWNVGGVRGQRNEQRKTDGRTDGRNGSTTIYPNFLRKCGYNYDEILQSAHVLLPHLITVSLVISLQGM